MSNAEVFNEYGLLCPINFNMLTEWVKWVTINQNGEIWGWDVKPIFNETTKMWAGASRCKKWGVIADLPELNEHFSPIESIWSKDFVKGIVNGFNFLCPIPLEQWVDNAEYCTIDEMGDIAYFTERPVWVDSEGWRNDSALCGCSGTHYKGGEKHIWRRPRFIENEHGITFKISDYEWPRKAQYVAVNSVGDVGFFVIKPTWSNVGLWCVENYEENFCGQSYCDMVGSEKHIWKRD